MAASYQIVIGLGFTVIVFGLLPYSSSPIVLIGLFAALGFCAVLEFPVAQAVTMEALPVHDRGAASGVWGMMMSLGGTVGLFVMSYIVSVAQIEWIFWFSAVFSFASMFLMVAMKGFFKS